MTYRDENQALRSRVEHLEEELAVLKGRKLSERTERDFATKVKRQNVLVVAVALLGTLGAGFCGVTMGMAAFYDRESVTAADLTAPSWEGTYSRRVTLSAELEGSSVLRDDWNVPTESRSVYSPNGYLIPVRGQPSVLVYCRSGHYEPPSSDCELAGDARQANEGDVRSQERLSRSREIDGRLYDIDANGYGYYYLEHADLSAYASERGVAVDDLRIVVIERSNKESTAVLFILMGLMAACALAFWVVFFAHRALARRTVELPTAADLTNRDPMMTVVLSIVTCGLYQLYWQYATTLQLRRLTGRPDLQPGIDLVLTIATMGLWTYWIAYRNAEAIDEGLHDLGEKNANHRMTAVILAIGTWVCGVFHWVMIYKLQEACNQYFLEKMSRDEVETPQPDPSEPVSS
jgi:hypothetical protein